ncbi:MAG TPA: hypothetical protein VIM53_00430 [Candidatus Saccharimonadales bacterium]
MKERYVGVQPLIEYDLASSNDYNRLTGAVAEVLTTRNNANQAYEEFGRDGLVDLVRVVAPETHDALLGLKEGLTQKPNAVVLHNTGVDQMADEHAQLTSIVLSSLYGEPTRTDRKMAQIAWPNRA